MDFYIWIPLIFAGLFLLVDVAMFVRMIFLLKKSKEDTVENLGKQLNPYLYATGIISVCMAICMIFATIMK